MAVSRDDDPARPGGAGGAAEQAQGGGGAEPDRLDAALADDPLHAGAHVGGGQEHARGHAHDVEGQGGVVGGGGLRLLGRGRGEDGEVLGGQAPGVVVEVGLDAADDGREVVGE